MKHYLLIRYHMVVMNLVADECTRAPKWMLSVTGRSVDNIDAFFKRWSPFS
jgi:hypothetical protein